MVIKCTLSITPEKMGYLAGQSWEVPPLPEYIIKKGPYFNNRKGAFHQIIILYKFDKSKFEEARGYISKQLGSIRDLPGFTLSAHIYGPRPYHFTLEKTGQTKKYPEVDIMAAPASVSMSA